MADEIDAVSTEIATLQEGMKDRNSAYWQDGGASQARYRELIESRETGKAAPVVDHTAMRRSEIEAAMRDGSYWRTPAMQAEYRALLEGKGNIPNGNIAERNETDGDDFADHALPALAKAWAEEPGGEYRLPRVEAVTSALLSVLPADQRAEAESTYLGLPAEVRQSIASIISLPAATLAKVTDEEAEAWADTEVGEILSPRWRHQSARNLAKVRTFVDQVRKGLTPEGRREFDHYLKSMPKPEKAAAFDALVTAR